MQTASSSTTAADRRRVLLLTSAALAAPACAVAAVQPHDELLLRIRAYYANLDTYPTAPATDAEEVAFGERDTAHTRRLSEASPTTTAGVIAALKMVVEYFREDGPAGGYDAALMSMTERSIEFLQAGARA